MWSLTLCNKFTWQHLVNPLGFNLSGYWSKILGWTPLNFLSNIHQPITLHKIWTFPLKIYSVNVTKSRGNLGFGHIWDKAFKNGPSKSFKGCLPQILLGPFLKTVPFTEKILNGKIRFLSSVRKKERINFPTIRCSKIHKILLVIVKTSFFMVVSEQSKCGAVRIYWRNTWAH